MTDSLVSEDVDAFHYNVDSTIQSSVAARRIPRKKNITNNTNPVPWWTAVCSKAVGKRKQRLRKARKSLLIGDCLNYKKAKALAQGD